MDRHSLEVKLFASSRVALQAVRLDPQLRRFFVHFSDTHGRRFPWRSRRVSAYKMLLAEILLRQTRAESVAKVWGKLARRYPTPSDLARARVRALVSLLHPLGFYRQRTVALREIGKTLSSSYGGEVPRSLKDLLAIKHIGLYAASALLAFRFDARVPVVDTNVMRVLGRIAGLTLPTDLRRNSVAWSLAWAILPHTRVREHNYGLLDFAAMVCRPRAPLCHLCPIRKSCCYGSVSVVSQHRRMNPRHGH